MDDNLIFYTGKRPFMKEILSLQTIVLKTITINFETFMREYASPSSPIPKYFFEFLQKKYSQELLLNLTDFGMLKQEFLDFVLNIHLREISLKSVPNQCKIGAIKQKLIEIGNVHGEVIEHPGILIKISIDLLTALKFTCQFIWGINRFSLMGAFNFHHLQPVLSYLPNVKKLELEYSNCDDSTIKVIAHNCPLLTELNVYASLVSDKGMKYLCSPEKHKLSLESLTVSRTHVKDSGVLMILKHMPSIRLLAHENLSRIISNAAAKNEFSKDRVLNLTYVEIHNAKSELQPIAEFCPKMKHLFVKNIDNPEQLLICSAFKNLVEVFLSYVSGKRPSLCINDFLKTCGFCIKYLSLENFVLSIDVLVQSCPRLKMLELFDPVFEQPSSTDISSLKFEKLTHFKIYGCSLLSAEEIKSPSFIVKSSPNMESMSLQCCFIGDQMEDVILSCPATLMQLDFTESLVSIDFLHEVLLEHKLLQCLIIENSGLHSVDFQNLFALIDDLNHPVNILWC